MCAKKYKDIRVQEKTFDRLFGMKALACFIQKKRVTYDDLLNQFMDVYEGFLKEAEKRKLYTLR